MSFSITNFFGIIIVFSLLLGIAIAYKIHRISIKRQQRFDDPESMEDEPRRFSDKDDWTKWIDAISLFVLVFFVFALILTIVVRMIR